MTDLTEETIEAARVELAKRRRSNTIGAVTSSESDHWCTPNYVLEVVRRLGAITLDPCWSPTAITNPAVRCVDPRAPLPPNADFYVDGLAQDWSEIVDLEATVGGGLVFVNHPYSQNATWCEKIVDESEHEGMEICTLTRVATGTRWWDRLVWQTADAVAFFKKRVPHIDPATGAEKKGSTFDSALVYHGYRPAEFLLAAADRAFAIRLDGR